MNHRPVHRFLIPLLAVILLFSCNSTEEKKTVSERAELKVSYVDMGSLEPTAKLIIDGMTCERMCVNAVKKSIAQVPTVRIDEMIFDADVVTDTLIVHFDPSQVSELDLVKAIEDLAGGDTYHVKEVQLDQDGKSSEIKRKRTRRSDKDDHAAEYRFTVPNFFEVLRKVSL